MSEEYLRIFFIFVITIFLNSCIGSSTDTLFGTHKKIKTSSDQIECSTKMFDSNKRVIYIFDSKSTHQSTIVCDEDRINPCFPHLFKWTNSGEIETQKTNSPNEIVTLKFFLPTVEMAKINYECYQ